METMSTTMPLSPQSSPAQTVSSPGLLLPMFTLWQREMVRFFRQRNRVVSALVTPIFLWILLGSGLDRMFVLPVDEAAGAQAIGYRQYFFPGTLAMIVLFTAIFSTISVIEDRKEGFLQAVLAAPVSRVAIVLGKVMGGASIALIHALIFMLAMPLITSWPGAAGVVGAVVILAAMSIALTALGLCIAWPMDSTAGFHAVMMLFLMPMWFLSGALFPATTAPVWLQWLMWLNPLTYGHAALTQCMFGAEVQTASPFGLVANLVVLAVFSLSILALATMLVRRIRKDGR